MWLICGKETGGLFLVCKCLCWGGRDKEKIIDVNERKIFKNMEIGNEEIIY